MTDSTPEAATVVAVASGKGGVGKTTTAVELAATLAELGQEVVVVDCDLGMPNLGMHLDLAPATTFHDVLAGEAPVEEAMVEVEGFTAVPGNPDLDGFAEADPDLLGDAVERLRDQFDVVILDTSPNLWTAAVPFRAADAAVLVATPDPSALDVGMETVEFVARYGVTPVGTVVVGADADELDGLEEAVADLRTATGTVVGVPDDDAVPDSQEAGRPVVDAAPDGEAAAAYRQFAGPVWDAVRPGTDRETAWEWADDPDRTRETAWEWADDPDRTRETAWEWASDPAAGPAGAVGPETDDGFPDAWEPVDPDPAASDDAATGDEFPGPWEPVSPESGDDARSGRPDWRVGGPSGLADVLLGGRDAGRRAPQLAYDPDRGLAVGRPVVVAAVVALQVLLVGVVVADPPVPLVRPILGATYGLFVPGLLVALLLDLDECAFVRTLVYSVGLSAVVILVVGPVMSFAYPAVGVVEPFSEGPTVATLTLVVFGLCAAVLARDERRRLRVPIHGSFSPAPLALALVPFLSVFGITFQNATGNNAVLLAMLGLLSVLPVVNAVERMPSRWLPLAVWVTAAALVYHKSLFGPYLGGPSEAAETLETGVWSPSEGSVLPNGVLFPTYVVLTGLRFGIETATVNPLLVSFLPVILFEGYREQIRDRGAFASVCLFMFSFPFYVLYPAAGRVATPVFFLALAGLVVSDDDVDQLRKRVLGIAFGAGLAVSHYGTAYVAMVAFEVALVTYALFKVIDVARSPLLGDRVAERVRFDTVRSAVRYGTPKLFSPAFVAFYVVFVVEWYFYTSGGEKFAVLPRKVLGVVNRFFEASASGTAASAVSKDYGSTSVAVSRQLYILIGALMGIGLAATLLARVVRKDAVDVDDEFLALGVGFMSMLGMSFFVVGFNVARIMMIVFTFTAVFVVYGASSVLEGGRTLVGAIRGGVPADARSALDRLLAVDFDRALDGERPALALVSVLLCAFLLLNSGVVTVFVTQDYAPSNIVTQPQLKDSDEVQVQLKARGCVKCNIESHAWLFAHRNRSNYAYGDYLAWAQVDYFRGTLSNRLGYYPRKITYHSLWLAADGTERQALVLLLDHNTNVGVILVESKYRWEPLWYLDPVSRRSHRVYTTGETVIYRSNWQSTEGAFDPKVDVVENGTTEDGVPVSGARAGPSTFRP